MNGRALPMWTRVHRRPAGIDADVAVLARDKLAQRASARVVQADRGDRVNLSTTRSLKLAAMWTMAFM